MSLKSRLMLPQEYIADATSMIEKAKRRVSFMCLIVSDGAETTAFIDALVEAAKRGVKVEVAADVFTYADFGGSFLPKRYQSKRRRASNAMARRLEDAGVDFTWLGKSRKFIYRGRTHIKFCVVDDLVYSFGGVNLYDKGATNIDYMFKVKDADLAQRLTKEFKRLKRSTLRAKDHKSRSFKYGKDVVLIDGDTKGDSIIYRRAVKYARKAERVLLVSQYCPSGKLGRLIRRLPHELYFNAPANSSFPNNLLIRFSMFVSRNRSLYRKSQYLHAKCIVFYLPGEKRVAITGSHNYVWGGVLLGTREIALQTKNPRVIDQLERFTDEHVRS